MSRLQENLDEILRQKQTYLKPENLRQGITAYGIEGQMTSENMWLPKYSSEGNYYILSFVNLEGNSNVETIIGYDGYRVVKFYNDTRYYLFDVRMNKPKQLTNEVPVDTIALLGYTDEFVYLCTTQVSGKMNIYKFSLADNTFTTVSHSVSGKIKFSYTYGQCGVVRHFKLYSGYDGNYGALYYYIYNPDTDTFTLKWSSANLSSTTATDAGNAYIGYSADRNIAMLETIGDYDVMFGYSGSNSDTSWNTRRYNVLFYNTNTNKKYGYHRNYNATTYDSLGYALGIAPSGNYVFIHNRVYNLSLSDSGVVLGAQVEGVTTPFACNVSSTSGAHFYVRFITSKVCIYKGNLYTYDETTLTFTKLVDTQFYNSQVSNTYLDVIVGWEFLGKDYYFNTGSSIIKDNKILNGHFARDQYNQTVQGTMPNKGAITINPSIETQTITEGYTSGITVNPVTYEIDSDIKPENIRYGVNILGVAGTLEQDAAESVMSQEEYDACMSVANDILGITE